MAQRLNAMQPSPGPFKKMVDDSLAIAKGGLDATLLHLVEIRASQINGCALCLDMHIKQAKLHGEGELRLHHLAIWRESPLFSERERAALAWTEMLTTLPPDGVGDADDEAARAAFPEQELVQLTHRRPSHLAQQLALGEHAADVGDQRGGQAVPGGREVHLGTGPAHETRRAIDLDRARGLGKTPD